MLLVATAAVVVAFGVGASVAQAAGFCSGAACGPSLTQSVTPSNVTGNDNSCPAGTTRIVFTFDDLNGPQPVSHTYNFGGQSGSVTVNVAADGFSASFLVTGGALAQVVKLHGGNGQGGSNSTNIYDYSGKSGGGVTNDSGLGFPGPRSDIFVCLINGPVLAVSTSSFHAAFNSRLVTVHWRTSSEVNTLGFNVYRTLHGKRVKLNKRLIPSASVLRGKSTSAYSFSARLASRRLAATSRYLLQEVHVNGTRTMYGPIRARNAA